MMAAAINLNGKSLKEIVRLAREAAILGMVQACDGHQILAAKRLRCHRNTVGRVVRLKAKSQKPKAGVA